MCNIAGYTGPKRASPVLLEMIRREEMWDGNQSTGIATVSGGKIFCEKTVGNSDVLLSTTDAENLPGNTGIIHSRPTGNFTSHAHPFCDSEKLLACVYNGISRDVVCDAINDNYNRILSYLKDKGYSFSSETDGFEGDELVSFYGEGSARERVVHISELRALYTAQRISEGVSVPQALADASSEMPGDIVSVMLHKNTPDTIFVCRITRPMVAAVCEGETYIATTRFAFPDDIKPVYVTEIPCGAVCEITAGGIKITPAKLSSVATQQITPYIYKTAYDRILELLTQRKGHLSDFDLIENEFYTNWRDVWSDPPVDCRFKSPDGCLKPYAHLVYEVLYDLYSQGRLNICEGMVNGRKRFLVYL